MNRNIKVDHRFYQASSVKRQAWVTKWAMASCLLAFIVPQNCSAQVQPPQPKVTVSAQHHVIGLTYDSSIIAPGSGTTGSITAFTTVTCTYSNVPTGWSFEGYVWSPVYQQNGGSLEPGVVVAMTANDATVQARSFSAGNPSKLTCTAYFKDQNNVSHEIPADCYILTIGGPLVIDSKYKIPNPNNSPVQFTTNPPCPKWDVSADAHGKVYPDQTKPWFLQYFGSNTEDLGQWPAPDDPTHFVSTNMTEDPVIGKVSEPAQADGAMQSAVTVQYSCSGPVAVSQADNVATITPTGPSTSFGDTVPSAIFSGSFVDDQGVQWSGSYPDCSQQMPDSQHYTFTVHEPATTSMPSGAGGQVTFQHGRDVAVVEVCCVDTLGAPDSWSGIQERFDPSTLPQGNFWDNQTHPYVWTTDISGYFTDFLSAPSYVTGVHGQDPPLQPEPHHVYWAGSEDPTWGCAIGKNVGDYDIEYWIDYADQVAVQP